MTDTIVIATNNKKKCAEIKEILQNFQCLTLQEVGFVAEIEETGKTFAENAFIKARTVFQFLQGKYLVLADDSGLCVDALGGAPSVYSARYSGEVGEGQDRANIQLLLKNMQGKTDRNCHFTCAIAVCTPSGKELLAIGQSDGLLLEEIDGSNGFGYDPIFYSIDLQKSFASATAVEKNMVSHRRRALQKIAQLLQKEQNL